MKVLIALSILLLSLTACVKPSPLQTSMEQMAESYKAMRKAKSVGALSAPLAQFKQGLTLAKQQQIPTEQNNFDKGLAQIEEHIVKLEGLIASKDMEAIKKELTALDETKVKYHEMVIKEKH